MGGAPAVLTSRRIAAFLALAVVVGVYYGTHQWWFELSLWPSLAWICLLLIPAVFGLVWLALPLWRAPLRQLVVLAVACGAAAVLLQWAGAGILANFGKLAAMTLAGWCFLRFFEELSWVVLVACIVPWVDAYSVWRGPTKVIVTEHREVFTNFSFAFPIPGQPNAANLGLPDLLFFALFLGAADRFALRVRATWLAMTLSFGLTLAGTYFFDVSGLPALPLLALGFLAVNADLLWRAFRRWRGEGRAPRAPETPAHRESAGEDPPP